MLNTLARKELSFTTTCTDAKIYTNCKVGENQGLEMQEEWLMHEQSEQGDSEMQLYRD